jgi:SWI/SNF-related matrix-associated actin-dependent regulator 1 of chromatin subfamily A
MHTVMNTLCRGSLGTRAAFERDWCSYVANKLVVADPAGARRIPARPPLMLRRRKDDVQLELPAKRRVIEPIKGDDGIFAEMVKGRRARAQGRRNRRSVRPRADGSGSHPRNPARHGAGQTAGRDRVPARADGGRRADAVLCAPSCRHRRHLEALEGFKPVCITGRQDKTQKDDAVTAFARGDTNLCLISLRTATGIDGLQKRARVVVFAELDWSPAVHRQAEDRAHRMGQRDSVLAYYLVTDLGTDPFVMMTLNLKASQFTGLMQDRTETDDDRRDADAAAKDHMAGVLSMLRVPRDRLYHDQGWRPWHLHAKKIPRRHC